MREGEGATWPWAVQRLSKNWQREGGRGGEEAAHFHAEKKEKQEAKGAAVARKKGPRVAAQEREMLEKKAAAQEKGYEEEGVLEAGGEHARVARVFLASMQQIRRKRR